MANLVHNLVLKWLITGQKGNNSFGKYTWCWIPFRSSLRHKHVRKKVSWRGSSSPSVHPVVSHKSRFWILFCSSLSKPLSRWGHILAWEFSYQWPLLFIPSVSHVSARLSGCLADVSSRMTAPQPKRNPSQTELLYIPGDTSSCQGLAVFSGQLSDLTTCHCTLSLGSRGQLSALLASHR